MFFSKMHCHVNELHMKKNKSITGLFVAMILIAGCEDEDSSKKITKTFSYTFSSDAEGWTGDFADYPIGQKEKYELHFEHATLPSPLNTTEGALLMTGSNQSDDLFMFIKRKISGLSPGATYSVNFAVEFASDVPDGLVGVGGSPGESVFIKAGASRIEPMKIESSDGYYRMNIDKGNQSQEGADMIVIGDFSNDTDSETYVLVERTNENPFQVQADGAGELWLIVGTESGFEATTTIYYNEIEVTFR